MCEVFPDAILGQDFLLKHVSAIDYKRLKLNSRDSSLSCWIASEMSCRVEVSETTVNPPHSGAWITMKLPRANKLAPVGMIAGKKDLPPGLQYLYGRCWLCGCIYLNSSFWFSGCVYNDDICWLCRFVYLYGSCWLC